MFCVFVLKIESTPYSILICTISKPTERPGGEEKERESVVK